MERKKERLHKYLRRLSIYKEDIEDIRRYASKIGSAVKIETDRYEFSDWDEFFQKSAKISSLQISVSDAFVYININTSFCSIHCSQKEKEYLVHFHEILEILEKCKRKEYFILHQYIGYTMALASILALVGAIVNLFYKLQINFLAIAAIAGSYNILFFFFNDFKTRIFLKTKDDVHGFWERKGEGILADIIAKSAISIIGFIAGMVAEHFLKLF